MIPSILSRLTFLWRNDERDEESEEAGGRFRPSPLDASVLYAHGMDVERLDDEIADIEERAREIDEARRGK